MVGLCVLSTGHRALSVLRHRRLIALGQISYGVYLYHNLLFALAQKFGGREHPPGWLMVAMAGLTLAIAALSWRFIERPILTLKDRFRGDLVPSPSRRQEVGLSGGGSSTWVVSRWLPRFRNVS